MTSHCHYCGINIDRIKQLEAQLEYWKKDSAAAWDKCEERRLENEQLEAQLATARKALKEADQFIRDGECDEDDMDVQHHRSDLLDRIAALTS